MAKQFPQHLPTAPLYIDNSKAEELLSIWRNQKSLNPGRSLPPSDLLNPDSEAAVFMQAVQGNVLRPHGRNYVRLVFIRFHGDAVGWRAYLKEASGLVTTAHQQWVDARKRHGVDGDPNRRFAVLHVSKAGVDLAGEGGDPNKVMHRPWSRLRAFRDGMWAQRGALGDVDAQHQDLEWEDELFNPERSTFHAVWLLARHSLTETDVGKKNGLENLDTDIAALGGGMAEVVRREDGLLPHRAGTKDPVEPFGFKDGISMPTFFQGPDVRGALVNRNLADVMIGEPARHVGGSFMVLRKLRQHVQAFRDFEEKLRPHLDNPTDPGRLVIGRFRDGRPLNAPGGDHEPNDAATTNAFDFSQDEAGARCPFHAHIRRSNPRIPALDKVQIVRRSAVYGLPSLDWRPEHSKLGDVGLLFMAYMQDIGSQFVKMQSSWYSDRRFGEAPDFGDSDRLRETLTWPPENNDEWRWKLGLGAASVGPPAFQRFVTALGGVYLYMPPLAWLRNPRG